MPNSARYETDQWRFKDIHPFNLLGLDSINAINDAIPNRMYTYDNFRPNILVKALNGFAWDEVHKNWDMNQMISNEISRILLIELIFEGRMDWFLENWRC